VQKINGWDKVKSLLLLVKDEYLSKGIAVALMDYFTSIHSTKNPFEAINIVKNKSIDLIITEVEFNTLDTQSYIDEIFRYINQNTQVMIIKDEYLDMSKLKSNTDLIIFSKPLSIQKIINVVKSFENVIEKK